MAAKSTTTIRQVLSYQPHQAAWFAATQTLFNQVVAFYFEVIQAHEKLLELNNKDALTALEMLTHTTQKNPTPVMPLEAIREDLPALFRRAAINAALGSARSFFSHLHKWRKRKEKAVARGKTFTERPPVPPRTWNKSVPFYGGQWKERTPSSILLKVWTGTCWSWLKVRITGRELPTDAEPGSPSLIRRGQQWWLHTPIEKRFARPATIERQVTTSRETTMCAVDLNLDHHLAVCTIQTVEGTILATTFIGGGQEINGFRKQQLGRIARNRRKTGIIAQGEQDNGDLWRKIKHSDESLAHLVSARIIQFAHHHGATILVFEHLGNLKPERGRYSRRGNSKRAFWMKGRIFTYAKYKAWDQRILTSRVNPRNTSRECARCHALVARYHEGQPAEEYTEGAPLVLCHQCGMQGHADRNASLVVGQRLVARAHKPRQEKPSTPLPRVERVEKSTGVLLSQEAKRKEEPSTLRAGHGGRNEHGTAQGSRHRMGTPPSFIPRQLRLPLE
ncbi:MAG TPA: transposase [Ktedonobacteraceae bacterium]